MDQPTTQLNITLVLIIAASATGILLILIVILLVTKGTKDSKVRVARLPMHSDVPPNFKAIYVNNQILSTAGLPMDRGYENIQQTNAGEVQVAPDLNYHAGNYAINQRTTIHATATRPPKEEDGVGPTSKSKQAKSDQKIRRMQRYLDKLSINFKKKKESARITDGVEPIIKEAPDYMYNTYGSYIKSVFYGTFSNKPHTLKN